jgi:folate-binding protein YgfZ
MDAYRAATTHAALMDRSDRLRVALRGRAPEQVLVGLVSGRIPRPLTQERSGVWRGRAEPSALLTPKGRMVAVARLLRGGPGPDSGFLLDAPAACAAAALDHLRKFVPPRLATIQDESATSAMFTVLGPRAAELLAAHTPHVDGNVLTELSDGDLVLLEHAEHSLTVIRTAEVATPAFDVLGDAETVGALVGALTGAGAHTIGPDTWEVLRIEAGEPAYGVDMDDTTIPVEAGIHTRVVDYQKGCFTGQEVLIRIRDRGHVNRLLRGLRFGESSRPAPGTQLFVAGEERAVGHVTSAASSPRFGEVIGLGYVRREVTPPAELRLGDSEGRPVNVQDLQERWRPDAGST